MSHYRLYCLRGMVLADSVEIRAESDAEAVLGAQLWARPGHVVEVWHDHRRIRTVGPSKAASVAT
jgi:hypothetical protein